MQNVTDEELMLGYQRGETAAMDELVERYKNPVYHFAFRLSSNASDAQEITQEVFLKIHQNRAAYQPLGKFSTWIFSIAHNLCISRLRKQKWFIPWPRKKDDSEELVDFKSPDPSPQETAAENETCRLVRESIECLPFLQKEALILREYENLDYAEIARVLHKTQGTVKILIYRARQNLKSKLLPYIKEYEGGLS